MTTMTEAELRQLEREDLARLRARVGNLEVALHGMWAMLRACADDPMWANHAEVPKSLCAAAADMLDAARVVGTRQEQIIMDHEREIERLRAALELRRDWQPQPKLPTWPERA